jgi:hypothetical protein
LSGVVATLAASQNWKEQNDTRLLPYLTKRLEKCIALSHIQSIILYLIYKSKLSVCVDKNWAVPGRFFQSLPVPCEAGDKQGRAARAAAVGGRARWHFY